MNLLFDGENAFFAERTATSADNLVLHLPKGASIFFNGICYFPKNRVVKLPAHVLCRGVNALSLRIENRLFPTESLDFDGEQVSPHGLSYDSMLLTQHQRCARIEDTLASLRARITALEEKNAARMLFS